MPDLDWTTRREGGVTLVELTVTNDADGPRRVRVRSAVPVLPPRSDGVPVTGWTAADDDRVAVVEVPPGATRGLGYASPETAEPPAALVDAAPPEPRQTPEPVAETPGVEPTPEGVVRDLPAAGPPRDAVPPAGDGTEDPGVTAPLEADGGAPAGGAGERGPLDPAEAVDAAGTGSAAGNAAEPGGDESNQPATDPGDDGRPSPGDGRRGQTDATTERARVTGEPDAGGDLPPAVADWLDGVARRIDHAADLAAAGSGPEATALVAAAGGPGAVDRLADRVADDPDRLRRLAARTEALAERAEAIAVGDVARQRSP